MSLGEQGLKVEHVKGTFLEACVEMNCQIEVILHFWFYFLFQPVEIESIKTHPKYDANNFYNDFALLKLAKQNATFEEVKTICLPKSSTGLQ